MAHPLSIRLDDDLAARLERLARLTGRSKSFYVKQAIEDHIEDLEDLYIAQKVLERIADGRERLIPLEDLGRPRVDVVITREDVSHGKPDPEGFLLACARLGVPSAESFVFEDSRPGIAAARAAGMPVAFVRELSPEDNAGLADVAFGTLADAVPWVRERLGRRRA